MKPWMIAAVLGALGVVAYLVTRPTMAVAAGPKPPVARSLPDDAAAPVSPAVAAGAARVREALGV